MTVMHEMVAGVVCLVAGVGLGRIKNAAKLSAIKAELVSLEQKAVSEARDVIAAIRKHL